MDWDSKLSQWEIPELEQNHLHPNQITLNPISVGPSPSPFQAVTRQIGLKDCSIDLKLGGDNDQSTNLGSFQKDQSRVDACTRAVQPPVKRARGPTSQTQMIVLCSVDGCGSDLSNCRDYHRRHKVCETHSKTPIVLVGGKEQRFCQQCSRFHMLTEFDEIKRSCRKRLDGHNRRRRKPQPDSINHRNSLLSNHHQVNQFSNYASVFRTTIPESTWSGPGSKTLISNPYLAPAATQPSFSLSFPQTLKETKRFPFLYESTPTFTKPIPFSVSVSSESSGSGSSSGGGNSNKIIYSECALSLLSSPPASAPAAASDLTVGPACQSLFSGYQYPSVTATGFVLDDLHEGNAFVSDSDSGNGMGIEIGIGNGNGNSGLGFQDMYHVSNEGPSLGEGSSNGIPFWHH
ncbi:hypothetical protein LUZ60_007936 [Juncus effusus]|nr:hypothetical protein LUZ60_007936 [Juncus effusus]